MSKRRVGAASKANGMSIGRSKEDNNLLDALKLYEAKNYKKSLKLVETTLKKNSQHVDSLALKALNLYCTDQKAEAETYVQKALSKSNVGGPSPIGCHILGIYMRNEKRYPEAANFFQTSLDTGSTNKQIYRDLATLYSQEHDYKNLLRARKAYWEEFMGYRANWTSLAIAHDLNGQQDEAANVLTKFEELAKGKLGETEAYEHNECLMYKNDLLYRAAGGDSEKLQRVLKHLDEIELEVFDKYAWLERRAAVYLKMNDKQNAAKVYRTLIKRNPDNFQYYRFLEIALGIQNDEKLKTLLYKNLQKFYPRAEPPKFIPLTYVKGEAEYAQKLSAYLLPQLQRGVPATFGNVKPLYKGDRERTPRLAEKIVLDFVASLDSNGSPLTYVWTCYYLCQHYLYSKDLTKARDYIDSAIAHTPTLVELYILKARVLKHAGLLSDAAETVNEGRKLDFQDRFINTKTVKYYLRANLIEKAVEVVSIFTKNDGSVNGVMDLHLMEGSWYVAEEAESYYRLYLESKQKLGVLKASEDPAEEEAQDDHATQIRLLAYQTDKFGGLALKRWSAISKFYKQFKDDQLDFHSYCMRKGVPRAYLEMYQWGKSVYTLPIYVRAMRGAARLYFSLHDELQASQEDNNSTEETPAVKKGNKKAKKEAAAFKKRREDDKKAVLAYEKDDDILGEKLISTTTPLQDFAEKFYLNYAREATDSTRDYLLEFEYQLRCGKLSLCLGALVKYADTQGERNSMVGAMLLCLLDRIKSSPQIDEMTKKIALKGLERHFTSLPLDQLENKEFDWITFYRENYEEFSLGALLLIRRSLVQIISLETVKQLILENLGSQEPAVQDSVLKYDLN
ncbi:LANO_0A04390g1_1 [Lachancea nothofagi CBS 11611]|uniref:LANO_0A04390g1_1 n=1 Tax=Lachancea nothofagi CBS 11611 TaxID=1266666 RepID=A0A1G4IQ67_9SACH|nr:LANO_0A04390g1_1 [Lachancea nothofagi CBS 11611]